MLSEKSSMVKIEENYQSFMTNISDMGGVEMRNAFIF